MTAIEIRDVFRIHSTPEGDAAALQGLTLAVAEGELVVVLGPSGSGKTSLLRLVAGLDRPTAGRVEVFGQDVGRLSARAAARYRAGMIGYAEQHYVRALAPELRVEEYLAVPLALRGVDAAAQKVRVDELLGHIGLEEKRRAFPHQLSGGEQQRVVVAGALAHRPRLLLADEPTGELDAENAARLYELIGTLARANGTTALIVSHDPASTTIAERVVHLSDGRVAAEASLDAGATESIVVGRGGWLRVPEEWLSSARIDRRAHGRIEQGQIVLEPAGDDDEPAVAVETRYSSTVRRDARTVAELRDVSKSYGSGEARTAVFDGLTSSFDGGRLYALTGPSGSGKTTALHLLAGLDEPTSGDVTVTEVALAPLDARARARLRARSIGYVGQQSGLIPFLSAIENVELALTLRGRNRADAHERATIALLAVGLAERMTQRVSRLSNGEQARVALARAFAPEPELILVDEPTARVDEANARHLASLLARLARETNAAVICATHDERLIEQADVEITLAA